MPGGVVKPIPKNVEAAILRMVPEADFDAIRSCAQKYQIYSEHSRETPRQTRISLSGIVKKAVHLRRDLQLLSEESRDAIGDWSVIDATIAQLSHLIGESKSGHNDIQPKDGRPASAKAILVRDVAEILGRAGYVADARPNGTLVPVITELLAVYVKKATDETADPVKLVRNALEKT